MSDSLIFRGTLEGHSDWVTAISVFPNDANKLITSSRDKTLIIWELTREEESFGLPTKSLKGHSHFVSDVAVSSDGQFALSASWDKTIRLWNLALGETSQTFIGHTGDVLSVAFSADDRQIISGSRDSQVKVWNTRGENKFTLTENGHTDWVNCVRFIPPSADPKAPVCFISASADKTVRTWNMNTLQIRFNQKGHNGGVNTVAVSPDGSLVASGGKDCQAMLWDQNDAKHLYSLDSSEPINALAFCPNRYWLVAAAGSSIKVWDLATQDLLLDMTPQFANLGKRSIAPQAVSLAWSNDGELLFVGYTDNLVRVYSVSSSVIA
ncbi:methylated-DNA-[protein]-cysteine S-methyltransferase [Fonticula alba]|uniref:Methylated-DNA-[protein]-cysteine S-methyltransferase n=1 Tax=Fonticula alba TaxID=691883 RepID=A0A058Z6H7_FONAL|nr:methylated-DNA-[protein]-cysteine S-methyltransferase [Fonticula alba]KCV69731.1 methylated-DNA-[protein]-cysteine S-methyltransferase [Fonticula alba]|eukprot:XP_009496296.1 methylated-DNA-[protein]-cysteine S-methyltransferase [Fonticula alba]